MLAAAIATLAVAGCSPQTIVTTDDPAPTTPAAAPPPTTRPPDSAHLLNAFDYGIPVDGRTRYFFTTPSGRWQCGIIAREVAGCEAASGSLTITGAPETVIDAAGDEVAPTAVEVAREGDARFAASDEPRFTPESGPAKVVPFNRILAVGGFRCNVQEATGISCLSERSGRGFTFSDEGFAPRYTDVPPGAP